ncbi:MAG: asparagine synthase (glutamine-hydrolyzing) [Calditrichia bacterium]
MCGIAGIATAGIPLEPALIAAMCDVIDYRGPDDFGYLAWQSASGAQQPFKQIHQLNNDTASKPDVLLGHRRLSILDLSENGRQPFSYADGRLWMVFNGEVYNYLELRDELIKKGHAFKTQTDTEVVLAAYLEWGEDCLRRFNGMFAFAILDCKQRRLFCVRDRLGIKPFHYSFVNKRFSFSSEIKQLLQLPWLDAERHDGIFFDYLAYKAYSGSDEQTSFRNIFQLKPGHYLSIPLGSIANSNLPVPQCWWDIDLSRRTIASDEDCADRYRELLTDAVRLRLRADVPVGTCLSGGLDSSGIVCIADKLIREKNPSAIQKTFTATSEDLRFDESDYAQAVIDRTQVEPHFTQPTADALLEDVEKLVWHHDEPFISTSIFAGWKVFELVSKSGVTVTLDGQGPDEMIGGYYTTMMEARMAEDLATGRFVKFFSDYRERRKLYPVPFGRIAKVLMLEFPGMARFKRHAADMAAAAKLFQPEIFEKGFRESTYLESLDELNRRIKGKAGLFNRRMYLQTMRDILPGILRNVDRNSMAFSVESRVPFLDHRLVEFSFTLPAEMKIRAGSCKWIYREAMKDILPSKVLDRVRKIGFATAEEMWIRGAGRTVFQDVFHSIPADAQYKRDQAITMLQDFLDGKRPFDTMLWRIFNSELWHRQYLGGRSNEARRQINVKPSPAPINGMGVGL